MLEIFAERNVSRHKLTENRADRNRFDNRKGDKMKMKVDDGKAEDEEKATTIMKYKRGYMNM